MRRLMVKQVKNVSNFYTFIVYFILALPERLWETEMLVEFLTLFQPERICTCNGAKCNNSPPASIWWHSQVGPKKLARYRGMGPVLDSFCYD